MDLILKRKLRNADGIFSDLFQGLGTGLELTTLEHAYPIRNRESIDYAPKIPNGIYTCVRGMHQLEHGWPFETFEVTGVAGHSGILFHIGNFNADSDGCILLGTGRIFNPARSWIMQSHSAFAAFMRAQLNVKTFQLTVL